MSFSGKVLVVDDEAHIRKFVSLVVKSLGQPTVVEAANGEEAVQAYAREQPDLVLLDVNMPRIDGLQALQQLRRQDPDCVVVMLTSLVNRQTVDECLRLGAAGYLRKDTPRQEIADELRRIIAETFEEPEAPQ
ncbi:MAG TPA: response regulator transcription factor [Opitutaceae bacterium]|nr:response regulator transcription factor [Opitutaceae bacterium]